MSDRITVFILDTRAPDGAIPAAGILIDLGETVHDLPDTILHMPEILAVQAMLEPREMPDVRLPPDPVKPRQTRAEWRRRMKGGGR